jgi:hypothetical protein
LSHKAENLVTGHFSLKFQPLSKSLASSSRLRYAWRHVLQIILPANLVQHRPLFVFGGKLRIRSAIAKCPVDPL